MTKEDLQRAAIETKVYDPSIDESDIQDIVEKQQDHMLELYDEMYGTEEFKRIDYYDSLDEEAKEGYLEILTQCVQNTLYDAFRKIADLDGHTELKKDIFIASTGLGALATILRKEGNFDETIWRIYP
jgi:hypothetical protein